MANESLAVRVVLMPDEGIGVVLTPVGDISFFDLQTLTARMAEAARCGFYTEEYAAAPPREIASEPIRSGDLTDASAGLSAEEDLHSALVEFAKAGAKADFCFLARSAGVHEPEALDELWAGARQRLRLPVEVA